MQNSPEFGDSYRLIWRKPETAVYIGEVRNYTLDRKGYRRIPIVHDDILMEKMNMRLLVAKWEDTGPIIYVSTAFMAITRKLQEAGIWHEIGHIHHEHHLRGDYMGQSQLRNARLDAIKNGTMLPIEEEADRFAATRMGKYTVLSFLEYVLSTRPSGEKGSLNEMGKRELEMRIAAIRTNGEF